jgi:chromosome segregation ATPase
MLTPTEQEKARAVAVKEIVTVDDAVDKLISRQYAIPDQEYSNASLASILFQLTAILPAEGAIIKAVAILLNELDLDQHATHVTAALMETLVNPLEEFSKTSAAIQSHADHVIDGHNSIENCVLEVVSRIDNLQAAFTETQEQAQSNTTAIKAMHSTLKNLTLPTTSCSAYST